MAIYAPKASANPWFCARERAAEFNEKLSSREGESDELGIERTRLARIETGIKVPYADEVVMMAECYKAPELRNYYCRECCPLGKNLPVVESLDIDRIGLRALSSIRKVTAVKEILLDIVEDGKVDETERGDFSKIIETLDELNQITQNMRNWAEKNMKKGV